MSASTPVKNLRILVEQSFTAHEPLLSATSGYGCWNCPQCCYLRKLHRLPVRQRVRFKLACIMYKSLHGQAPSTWPMMSNFSLTADGVSFDQPTTEHALPHEHRTVLATETFVLPDPESETIFHRNCDT